MSNKKRPYMFCKAVVRRKGPLYPRSSRQSAGLSGPAGTQDGRTSFSSPSGEILRAFRIIAIKKQPYMFCKAVVRRKGLEPPTF